MKNLTYLALTFLVIGCSHKSPYDITPDQAQHKVVKMGTGIPDMNHLPPGAVKHEQKVKKGDKLPDGSIATHDGKIVTVEVNQGGYPGM